MFVLCFEANSKSRECFRICAERPRFRVGRNHVATTSLPGVSGGPCQGIPIYLGYFHGFCARRAVAEGSEGTRSLCILCVGGFDMCLGGGLMFYFLLFFFHTCVR